MLREVSRSYSCSKCGHEFEVAGDISRRGAFTVPKRCPSSDECRNATFSTVEGAIVTTEYQEIKITERAQDLDVGSIPRSIIIVLTDDLADKVKPGDDVVVTGILALCFFVVSFLR